MTTMPKLSWNKHLPVLVVNAGSSSVKFAVVDDATIIWHGQLTWSSAKPQLSVTQGRRTQLVKRGVRPTGLLAWIQKSLVELEIEPGVIAHRMVHGGPDFFAPTKLQPAVLKKLRQVIPLAPLHMPLALQLAEQSLRRWPLLAHWAVFDTEPYEHLPLAARTYAIPLALAQKFGIRKYGFHGISHAWALEQSASRLHRPVSKANVITIHLGAGDSMTRWVDGHAVDTTMGFTPLEGLTMSTRSGDLDPMIPLWLQQHGHLSVKRVTEILEQRSGLLGISGLRDMRDILSAIGHAVPGWPSRRWTHQQRAHAQLAFDIFIYDAQRYLASYSGLLERLDALVFTGAIGENPYVRQEILRGVPGVRWVMVHTVPAEEERAIAWRVRSMYNTKE